MEGVDMAESNDETKRRFKEALDRKNHQSKTGTAHTDGHAKADHAHGPAAQKREFRRKSG
jgi:hypothetical protein